jgi:hypothetical protein
MSTASRCLTEAGHHRPAPGNEFFFFLERVNPKGDIQWAKACNAGDKWQAANSSDNQAKNIALQPTKQEEANRQQQ